MTPIMRTIFCICFVALFCASMPLESALRSTQRRFLITGCSRSGTWYITKVLEMCGLEVAHEGFARDGIVSWCALANTYETPWGPGRKGMSFDHIFHQVREPLAAISSIYYTDHEPAIVFAEKYLPQITPSDSRLVKVVKFWIYWNQNAEKLAEWTYRIEDIEEILPIMGEKLGVFLDPLVLNFVDKGTNHRNDYVKFRWREIRAKIPTYLYNELVALSCHYGYGMDE